MMIAIPICGPLVPLTVLILALAVCLTGCDEEKNNVHMEILDGQLARTSRINIVSHDNERKTDTVKPVSDDRLRELESRLCVESSLESDSATRRFKYLLSGQKNNEYDGKICFHTIHTQIGSETLYLERVWGNDDLATELDADFKAIEHAAELLAAWLDKEYAPGIPDREKFGGFVRNTMALAVKNAVAYRFAYADEEGAGRLVMYFAERFQLDPAKVGKIFRENLQQFELLDKKQLDLKLAKNEDSLSFILFFAGICMEYGMHEQPVLTEYLRKNPPYRDTAKFAAFIREQPGMAELLADKKKETGKDDEPDLADILFNGRDLLSFGLLQSGGDRDFNYTLAIPALVQIKDIETNGKIDEGARSISWAKPVGSQNLIRRPFAYAFWVAVDEDFQIRHFGKVIVDKSRMSEYVLFISRLSPQELLQWNNILEQLKPCPDPAETIRKSILWPEDLQKELGLGRILSMFEPPKT